MLKRIGAEESGEFKAVASGTLPSGKPVVVNADGTVSVVSGSDASVGSAAVFESAQVGPVFSTFDSSNNKVVIFYRDYGNSNYGTAVVGTVSGSSISFGTPVVFKSISISGDINSNGAVFDSSNNKVVAIYSQGGNGRAVVGTVSGTSISFGSEATFDETQGVYLDITFDSTNNKVVVVYAGTNNYVETKVGTVSGTSISFGTAVVAMSLAHDQNAITFDSNRGKVVVCSRVSTKGRAAVGTVSGTSISFATNVIFADNQTKFIAPTFDSSNNKVVIAYINGSSTDQGQVVVGDIDGSGVISFGSAVTYNALINEQQGIAFDSNLNKVVIAYDSQGTSKGQVISGTVSGTSISFDSETVFEAANVEGVSVAFDSNANKSVISYIDAGNLNYGTSVVFTPASTTLTSENYIGMSRGVVSYRSLTGGTGSETVFETAAVKMVSATYDSNSEKVVIAYKDEGNSNQGTAIVGTVSGTSISFGTPAIFETGAVFDIAAAFDSSNNKVVIAYRDNSNSDYGTAVVGTVSGTGISFGTPVVFESAYAEKEDIVFDSSNSRIVIVYRDAGNSDKGTAIVGNVSGTSISFGTAVIFEDAIVRSPVAAFDSTNNKVVVAYEDSGNSDNGTAIVGTVDPSDNSISFGTAVVWETASTGSTQIAIAYDTTNSKVVISYPNAADSQHGYSIVGEVSGTSISFGTAVEFEGGSLNGAYINSIYNQAAEKIVVFYYDIGDSNKKKYVLGTVSGTSISFDTPVTVDASNTTPSHLGIAYISKFGDEGVIFGYEDDGNSSYGTSLVLQTGYTNKATRGEVANGGNASMDIIGSVSTNQIGLTAGQQYFVQTDGTIGTTADSPSVLAGTAISATELLVKT
jgi:hypothetical protein